MKYTFSGDYGGKVTELSVDVESLEDIMDSFIIFLTAIGYERSTITGMIEEFAGTYAEMRELAEKEEE